MSDQEKYNFEDFFDKVPHPLCIIGFDGRFERVNQAFLQALGYSSEELLAKKCIELVNFEDVPETLKRIEKLKAGQMMCRFENRYKKKDGTFVWMRWFGRLQGDCIFASAEDVTIEVERIEKIKKTDEMLFSLHETASSSHISYDEQIAKMLRLGNEYLGMRTAIVSEIQEEKNDYFVRKVVTDMNIHENDKYELGKTYCCITFEANEVVTIEHAGESDYKKHPAYLETHIESYIGAPITIQDRRYGTLNFSSSKKRLKSFSLLDKSFVRFVGQWISATLEKKMAYDDIVRFKMAVEGASDHIIITDPDGVIIYANNAAEKTTGFTREEMIGKTPRLWGEQMSREYYDEMWKAIREEKKAFHGEITNKNKRGDLYDAEVIITPILDENGDVRYYLGNERDVTEKKHIERMKTDFVSMASHQLRTPAAQIMSYVDNMLEGVTGDLSVKQKEYLQDMRDISSSNFDLIEDLLNISRLERGILKVDMRSEDITDIIQEALGPLWDMAKDMKKELVFEASFEEDEVIMVRADRAKAVEVVRNIVHNAMKFTREKTSVVISMRLEEGQVVISVLDRGDGIKPEAQSTLFSRKKVLAGRSNESGAGLGLYVAKQFMELMEGDISYTTQPGEGTTFRILFKI